MFYVDLDLDVGALVEDGVKESTQKPVCLFLYLYCLCDRYSPAHRPIITVALVARLAPPYTVVQQPTLFGSFYGCAFYYFWAKWVTVGSVFIAFGVK